MPADAQAPTPSDDRLPWGSRVRDQPPLGNATFAKFVSGMAAQAQIHLGLLANPVTGQREPNLDFARFTCELLETLRTKTAGNLDQTEQALLDATIADLRARLAEAPPA